MRKRWLFVLIALFSMTVASFVVLGLRTSENRRNGTGEMAVRPEEWMLPAEASSGMEPPQADLGSTPPPEEPFEMETPLSSLGPLPVSGSGDPQGSDGSLPLSELVGESGIRRLQNALSGLRVDWDAPVRFEKKEKETILVIRVHSGDAFRECHNFIAEVIVRIDDTSGEILRPDGYSPPTDETLAKWCLPWLTDGADSVRYRLELRRDVSDLCFAHLRLESDRQPLTWWCCVYGRTGQLLDRGIVFGNPEPLQAMRVFSSEPEEGSPDPTP